MNKFLLTERNVHLPLNNGRSIILSLTMNSGRIVYRNKIDTIIGIKHPGIEIAVDQFGNRWIAHHHYENGVATIEREDQFAKGEDVFYDNRPVSYNKATIVHRALSAWQSGIEYHWLRQNCQHFVNTVACGEHLSEAADQISDGAMITGGLLTLIGMFSGNKGLMNVGLVLTGTGAAGKIISRSR